MLVILSAIWQPCSVVLEVARVPELFHSSVRVRTIPVNYAICETAISKDVFSLCVPPCLNRALNTKKQNFDINRYIKRIGFYDDSKYTKFFKFSVGYRKL